MNAIVTGDTGLIGKALVDALLAKNYNVLGISRRQGNFDYRHISCDINNVLELQDTINDFQPDIVFHFAANARVKDGGYQTSQTNIVGTHKLLDTISCGPKFVFASSGTVYGKHSTTRTTLHYTKPSSVYGLSKDCSEKLIHLYYKQNKISSYLILRYVAHIGKNSTHGVVHDLINKLKSDSEFLELIGDYPGTKKPYLYIEDSISNTIYLAENNVGVYNISPKDSITIDTLAKVLMNEIGIHKPIKWLGKEAGWFGDDGYVDIQSNTKLTIRSSTEAIQSYVKSI